MTTEKTANANPANANPANANPINTVTQEQLTKFFYEEGAPYTGIPNTDGSHSIYPVFNTERPHIILEKSTQKPLVNAKSMIFRPKDKRMFPGCNIFYVVDSMAEPDSYYRIRIKNAANFRNVDITHVLNGGHPVAGEKYIPDSTLHSYYAQGAFTAQWGLPTHLVRKDYESLSLLEKHCVQMLENGVAERGYLHTIKLIIDDLEKVHNEVTPSILECHKPTLENAKGTKSRALLTHMMSTYYLAYGGNNTTPYTYVGDALQNAYYLLHRAEGLRQMIETAIATPCDTDEDKRTISAYTASVLGPHPFRTLGVFNDQLWSTEYKKKLLRWILEVCDQADALQEKKKLMGISQILDII